MIYRRIFVFVFAYSLLLLPISAQKISFSPKIVESFISHPSAQITAPGASSSLVISQFYGGGGQTGAVYTNDFVEIFNRGGSTVSLNGWSIQYANTVGTDWVTTPLPTATIQPGQYFLVQFASNGSVGSALPTPDYVAPPAVGKTFVANLSATTGKLAIVNSAAPLPAVTCPSGSPVVDFVGYGGANCSEASPVAATSVSTGAKRAGGGCTDTDTNSTDFTIGTPAARNSSTPLSACTNTTNPTGVGASSPSTANPSDPITLTVTVTPGSNPPSTGIAVTADLSPIGGSAAQSFYDDATHGDAVAGDNVFTFATNAGTSGGVKTINFAVTDTQDRNSNGSFQLTVNAPSNPGGTGTASPNAVLPGGSTTLTFNATQGTLPSSPITSVTANLSSIGGSASQAFTDSGDGLTFTFAATVANGTSTGLKVLPITITDAQARTGSGTINLTVGSATDPSHIPAEHELMGNPTAAGNTNNNDWLIERNQYVESYNCGRGIPNWVAWHLDSTWLGSASRTNNYRPDTAPPLPTSSCYIVQSTDYSGSGFDRGHDTPSGDRADTTPDNDATFLMTNFIPQSPNNNQGIWNDMENYIRTQVNAGNEAYIWMGNAGQGGIGSNNGNVVMTVANGNVVVPAYVWKVVIFLPVGSSDLARVDTNTRVLAVLTPNIQTTSGLNSNWMAYICPVSKIEQLTGMNFFPNVPTATASVLKQKIDSSIVKQTIAGGSYTNLTVNFPETYLTGNVTVTGNLTLGPETLNTTDTTGNTNFTITLAPGATVTRMNGGMVTGNLEKQYNAANQSFTYPVGTLNGYSPVTANLTALGTNPSSLTVKAVQGVEPNVTAQSTALKRYWTLTENGDLTTNLVFNYLDEDVPSGTSESSFVLDKYEGIFNQWPATIDPSANTVTTTAPVSQFSDWTLLPSGNQTPAPTVTGVSPTSGSTAGGTPVTITGTGFVSGATVSFGGSAGTGVTVVSPTQITVSSPAHAAGLVDVTVTTTSGTSAISASDQYTYVAPAPPTVTGVSPTSGPTAGGTQVTITGTGFTSGATVSFGGSAGTGVTVVSPTQITVSSPVHAAGVVDVTVTTTNGTSATSASDQFTYAPVGNTIAFSTNSYVIDEGGGHIDVTVTRSGDTSAAATVDYATSDGTAVQKSDYEIALGTVKFAAGETSKTFTVLIVDDKFVETGNEILNLTLSNPTGTNATLGTPNTATLTILDNDSISTTVNPYDDARFFVRQQYLDFLNREPDQSGWDFWTNEITSCGNDANCIAVKRVNVSAAFFVSNEFQATGFETIMAHRAAFGTLTASTPIPVVYTAFMHDNQELGKGYVFGASGADAVLEANKVAYFADFTTRAAFLAKYPLSLSNAQYVDNILTTANLPTNDAFRTSLVNGLGNGSETRASVVRKIAESTALKNREFNSAFVLMQYFGYLRRDPNAAPDTDYSGYNFWLQKLNDFGGNYVTSEMVKAFISATETRGRFGNP